MPPIEARKVAEWFLWRAARDESSGHITNLKLQKLVYYAQAWHLALSGGQPLFDDKIEAWVHGPVVPSLCFDYRANGANPIGTTLTESPLANDDVEDHLEEVWDIYGSYSGRYLEALTHQEAPWQIAREGYDDGERANTEISHESMMTYYQSVIRREMLEQ